MEIVVCEENYKVLKEDVKLKRSLSYGKVKSNNASNGYISEVYINWGPSSSKNIIPIKKESCFNDIIVIDEGFRVTEDNVKESNSKRK